MKNSILYISLLVILMFFSCTKDLDQNPISDPTTETFYAIPADFTQGIYAVYSSLREYPERQLNLSETRSDNLYAASVGGVRDWEGINGFHRTLSSNTYVAEAWSANYIGINRANVVLEQLSKRGDEVLNDPSLQSRLEAEARFLRAFFYFDLVRWFGKVPIVDKVITVAEAALLDRSPVADVYSFIISDLEYAANNLSAGGEEKGRVASGAAKTLLALVYMTRSGESYGIEGPGLSTNEWSNALDLLNDVLSGGRYSFLDSYPSIYSYTNENNAEVIFDIQYNTGSSPVSGAWFPAMLADDNWFKSLGFQTQGSLEIRPVSEDLLASYESGDARKSFSIQSGYVFEGTEETRSFWKKYVDITRVPTNRLDWPVNFIVFSYTDALLLKAECLLRLGTGQPEVDAIVNQVRNRAGLEPVSNVSQRQLLEERRKEFGAEGKRWHDLVRSGEVETVMTQWINTYDMSNAIQSFHVNYVIYPIPQSEIDAKPGIYTQNPGYN